MKSLPCSCGAPILLDDVLAQEQSQYEWTCGTLKNSVHRWENGTKIILSHAVLPPPSRFLVDHIDRNIHNNNSGNLRPATVSQNTINSAAPSNNSSGFKGVYWYKRSEKWRARIVCNGKLYELGLHATLREAGEAYNKAALELFGEFAFLNDLSQSELLEEKYWSKKTDLIADLV